MIPAICSPGALAPTGSNRPGWSVGAPALPPPTRLRRPASFDPKPPCVVPVDPGANSSTEDGGILEPPLQPITSPVSSRDDIGVAGLPGREEELPSPPASINWRRGPLRGLRAAATAPAVNNPVAPSFGGPGGPRAGRGRSQERQRNLELSREARTAGLDAFSSPLAPARPPGRPALETRAASLRWVLVRRDGEQGGGGGRGIRVVKPALASRWALRTLAICVAFFSETVFVCGHG